MRMRLERVGLLAGGRPSTAALLGIVLACSGRPAEPIVVGPYGRGSGGDPTAPAGSSARTDENGRDALARLVAGARATSDRRGATLVAIALGLPSERSPGIAAVSSIRSDAFCRLRPGFSQPVCDLLFAASFRRPLQLVLLIGCTDG